MTSSPASGRRSRASRRRWALAIWLGLTGLLVIGAFYGQGEGGAPEDALYDPDLLAGGLLFYGFVVAVTVGTAFLYRRPWRALGFRRFRPRWLWPTFGVVVGTVILSVALEPILHAGERQGFAPEEWQPEHAGVFVANALVTSLLAPFAEELFFRGLGIRALAVLGIVPAMVVTAVAFGLVHGLLVALPTLVSFALGLAWLRVRTCSIWPCVIAHAAYNGTGIGLLVLSWVLDLPVE